MLQTWHFVAAFEPLGDSPDQDSWRPEQLPSQKLRRMSPWGARVVGWGSRCSSEETRVGARKARL